MKVYSKARSCWISLNNPNKGGLTSEDLMLDFKLDSQIVNSNDVNISFRPETELDVERLKAFIFAPVAPM